MVKVNIREKLALFSDHWNPRIIGKLKPVADQEIEILLFGPASTLNIGNPENERTKKNLQRT